MVMRYIGDVLGGSMLRWCFDMEVWDGGVDSWLWNFSACGIVSCWWDELPKKVPKYFRVGYIRVGVECRRKGARNIVVWHNSSWIFPQELFQEFLVYVFVLNFILLFLFFSQDGVGRLCGVKKLQTFIATSLYKETFFQPFDFYH